MPPRNRIVVSLAFLLVPLAAHGQSRYTVGASGVYGDPLGEFGSNVNHGFGIDGMGTVGLDSRGIFSLRGDIGYIWYNRKSEPFFANTGFDIIELESETSS